MVYHIWPLMTFDLREGHHHSQLASAILSTKYGSHSTQFTIFDLWWPLTSMKVIIILSLHQQFFWPNMVAIAQFTTFNLWWPLTSIKVIIILSLHQRFFWPNLVAIAHLTSDDLWPPWSHHHLKLASVVLTKFGSPRALFNSFDPRGPRGPACTPSVLHVALPTYQISSRWGIRFLRNAPDKFLHKLCKLGT